MLPLLIALVWLAIVMLVVAVCRMAARGEALAASVPGPAPSQVRSVGGRLVVCGNDRALALRDRRSRRAPRSALRRRRTATHGVR